MSEENNIKNNNSITLNKKHVIGFFKDGFKKAFSTDSDTIVVSKRIKKRTFELYDDFKNIIGIFVNSFLILFYFFFGMFSDAKYIPHAFSRAANNNFRLGIENLKKNNLIDARIRFLLSDLFYSKSSTTKYYIAYVYYQQGNITKSLKYLKKSLSINSSNTRAIDLLKAIEKNIK